MTYTFMSWTHDATNPYAKTTEIVDNTKKRYLFRNKQSLWIYSCKYS